uniref:Uncharacterized protein n=1 Tax=Coccidioides posadasii RMSCC 3488 TaxID=454284 RepID=A0A0J6ILF0_COCPO|nr:hypothetical protein CPAG_09039 [Coccidioides posadasii RMSCC 3488]
MSVLAMKDQLKLNPKSNIDRPFSMLFISARASRRFQGTNMCCRPERLRVIRVLPLFPREHTIDPPSGRLLGIHQAIGIVPSSQWEEPRYFGTLVGGTVDLTHVVHLVDLMESLLRTAYVISLVCRPVLRPTKLIQTMYPPVALQGRHMPRHVPVVVFKSPKTVGVVKAGILLGFI